MKKNYKFFILIISALVLIGFVVFTFDDVKEEFVKMTETDGERFKREYEAINGKEAYGMKYPSLEIDKENPIKYSNAEEIESILSGRSGIIYLGYPNCPWCRTAVPVLLHAASDAGVDKIYYIDMSEERSSYKVEDGKLVLEKKGTDQYYKLLELFHDYLEEYFVQDEEGYDYFTGERRIYVPIVFFVKEGKIIGLHLDTVESQKNPFQALNEEQYEELYGIYTDYIHDMLGDLCDERC